MKRLTDRNTKIKIALQSLPVALAAIVFLLYFTTFQSLPTERMKRSTALIEHVSYYEIYAGGKAVARFKALGDGGMPGDLCPAGDTAAVNRRFTTGCFVNKYPMFPLCRGRILTINPDSVVGAGLAVANKNIHDIIKEKTALIEKRIAWISKTQEELDYYLRIHNVNDDGYNVMADYAEHLKRLGRQSAALVAALKAAVGERRVEIKHVCKYTLLYNDTAGIARRLTCNVVSKGGRSPFLLLQTADRTMPVGASALYMHQWLAPHPKTGESVIVSSFPGCASYGFKFGGASARTFGGTLDGKRRHGIPPLLAPDGSPVFSADGRTVGISCGGIVVPASAFGFGFKHLLP